MYASYADKSYLPALFDAYTKETGTIVIVRNGDAENIVDDVIRNDISPPADVLITPSVRGVHSAAEEGALRPLSAGLAESRVPAQLRDADNFWTALTYRGTAIVGDPEASDLESLADPGYRGRLCLSSSSIPSNRVALAVLIDKYGVRDAELLVRGWVANLARQPFDTEEKMLSAIAKADCEVGIASVTAAKRHGISFVELPGYADVEAAGVARHARNPEGAQTLIEWLLSDRVQVRHAESTFSTAASSGFPGPRNVSIVAWHYGEAVKLAERARYY